MTFRRINLTGHLLVAQWFFCSFPTTKPPNFIFDCFLSSVPHIPLPPHLCPPSFPCAGSRWVKSWMSGQCSMRRTRSCVNGSHRWRARSRRMVTSALKRWLKSCERWFQRTVLTAHLCIQFRQYNHPGHCYTLIVLSTYISYKYILIFFNGYVDWNFSIIWEILIS